MIQADAAFTIPFAHPALRRNRQQSAAAFCAQLDVDLTRDRRQVQDRGPLPLCRKIRAPDPGRTLEDALGSHPILIAVFKSGAGRRRQAGDAGGGEPVKLELVVAGGKNANFEPQAQGGQPGIGRRPAQTQAFCC